MSATRPTSGPTAPSPTAMPPRRPTGEGRAGGPENASGDGPGATAVPRGATGRTAEPTRAEPTRAEPTRAEPTRAEPTRAEPTRAELAERIAATVRRLPDVADLNGGPLNGIVTYRAGAPVSGVAVRDREVEVGVTARYGRPFPEVGEAVRAAVLPLAGDRRVNVQIVDIAGQDGDTGTGEGDA
ncbi:hypothetical protein ACQEU3_09625 [Spirillospora sp. CA-253888]